MSPSNLSDEPQRNTVDKPNKDTPSGWGTGPTAKERNEVQRLVTQLLDALAPERVLKRGDLLHGPIEQHRTPVGCVLQTEAAAVSVSWFLDTRAKDSLGELHVNVWQGVVSRGGSSYRKPAKATLVSELVLHPISRSLSGCVWRADDAREFDTARLAAHCIELLEQQVKLAGPSNQ